jgi:hypothetical protein
VLRKRLLGTLVVLVSAGSALGGGAAAGADVTPPETRIARGPTQSLWVPRAHFRFRSNEAGVRFACSLDRGAWRRCPRRVTFRRLEVGWHELRVRAVDAAGNRDRTPARRGWRYQPRVG